MNDPETVDRAERLFRFLARAQELKTRRVRTHDGYTSGEGSIQWLSSAPVHQAVMVTHPADAGDGDGRLLLSVERLVKVKPPETPITLTRWVTGGSGVRDEPRLIRIEQEQVGQADTGSPTEGPSADVQQAFDRWIEVWREWAERERRDAPVREFYEGLFRTHVQVTGRGEEFEFVLGVGLLAWKPEQHDEVRRHIYTCPLKTLIDDHSGRIDVAIDDAVTGLTAELDMLDPVAIPDRHIVQDVVDRAAAFEAHPFAREEFRELASTFVNHIDSAGHYFDDEERRPATQDATVTWAPALIVRPRRAFGLVKVLDTIADTVGASGRVPEGLLPLVDPNHTPAVTTEPQPGAVLDIDGQPFSPLPLNDIQRQIIERVNTHAQTLVQGPPGTGKTHTAAALLSHLLAQGKRVLVTAHTDRALQEVRGKLPDQIKPLSVSVVGASRDDMADLKVAVDTISRESSDFDHSAAEARIADALADVDTLRGDRQQLGAQLVRAREIETETHQHCGYDGTLATIAQRFQNESGDHRWIGPLVDFDGFTLSPLSDDEAIRWWDLLRDRDIPMHEAESRARLVALDDVPTPNAFARSIDACEGAMTRVQSFGHLDGHIATDVVRALPADSRIEVQTELHDLVREIDTLGLVRTQWMSNAIHDVRTGMSREWFDRHRAVSDRLRHSHDAIAFLGAGTSVQVSGDTAPLLAMGETLKQHLAAHGPLKMNVDGTPKTGLFASSIVKKVAPLFSQVRVNGQPPTTVLVIDQFRAYVDASRLLDELDHAWPLGVVVPDEDTLHERASWHASQLEQLDRVLALGGHIRTVEARFAQRGLPHPDWSDGASIRQYSEVIDAAAASDAHADAKRAVAIQTQAITDAAQWNDAASTVRELAAAVQAGDTRRFARQYAALKHLHEVRRSVEDRDYLTDRVRAAAPRLADAVTTDQDQEAWRGRLSTFSAAWAWGTVGAWIMAREAVDANTAQAKITVIEQKLREKSEIIAATRAWMHAVSSDRIDGRARANLTQYSQLVRRLGKGTGKYAARQRVEIREAMDRCRSAVPVWIMPIYRIAEQLNVEENMFDVILVDEASQAGVEATFLQFLAPKIVVIGDDKQVSPSAVGVDQEQLRQLAGQYLYDNEHKASWQDPKRSLFDEAVMRFGARLTLLEHRRCVPEIIGFSNRIAYEPDGVRLKPVRQFGADRLDPIKPVHLGRAYQEGTSSNRINRAEARAIVDQVKACCDDPAYDGKTFGVISLLGKTQVRHIESLLLEELSAEEWDARELRVGDAPDFQGSERDVMFLSMVASVEPGSRLMPVTKEESLQRYNVAASRAKDQMWLFHSVSLQQLTNPEDLRHQLVAYCHEIAARGPVSAESSSTVSDDERQEPFDSLFEQRVYNRIVERGYVVEPQFDANGYRIDLVVVGAHSRLAVECDGDHWHGPDAYLRDVSRQRDLERCGWTFFRVRESGFYVDPVRALAGLWDTLEDLDIRPAGWSSADEVADESLVAGDNTSSGVATRDAIPDRDSELSERSTLALVRPAPVEEVLASAAISEGSFERAAPSTVDLASKDATLQPYIVFDGETAPVESASSRELIDGLVRIARDEGPVIGERLQLVYVKASGGGRVGRRIAQDLNRALSAALRRGELVSDNPLNRAGLKVRTFRVPGQPVAVTRELGPRLLTEVPPFELAEIMKVASADQIGLSETELFRRTLALVGRKSLTEAARAQLRQVLPLLGDDGDEMVGGEQR